MTDKTNLVHCTSQATYIYYFCLFSIGVLAGWLAKSVGHVSSVCKDLNEGTFEGLLTDNFPLRDERLLDTNMETADLSKNPFSCNSMQAFEELTRLHVRAQKLREREKKGEANRARIATVHRKVTTAVAAENGFRNCVNDMMPEVLKLWDDKLKLGRIKYGWDNDKEKAIDGITYQTLEKLADAMDDP